MTDFYPKWASPPGETVAAILANSGLDKSEIASSVGRSDSFLSDLTDGKVDIDESIASDLEKILGVSKEFWLCRQADYEDDKQRIKELATDLEKEMWYQKLPIKEMKKLGWIPSTRSALATALSIKHFFSISNPSDWEEGYGRLLEMAAFKTSASFDSDEYHVTTWIRQGEIIASQSRCNPWDPAKFRLALDQIRANCIEKDPSEFLPKLVSNCEKAGVVLVVLRTPSRCRASGAVKFLHDGKALLLLSNRHRTDDHFWFSFFHEAGHLLLHGNDPLFIEGLTASDDRFEKEANKFAEEYLVPQSELDALISGRLTWKRLVRHAVKMSVPPGVLVGQLQHKGIIPFHSYNFLKRRYKWVGDQLALAPKRNKSPR